MGQDTEGRLTSEWTRRRGTGGMRPPARSAEALVEERTLWAQRRTEAEREQLAAELNAVRGSRWLKAGASAWASVRRSERDSRRPLCEPSHGPVAADPVAALLLTPRS